MDKKCLYLVHNIKGVTTETERIFQKCTRQIVQFFSVQKEITLKLYSFSVKL